MERERALERRAFVGLGGNLGDRLATLRSAVGALARVEATRVVGASSVYETKPLGPSEGAFLNAVAELRTRLLPAELLARMLEIEAEHGRERRRKWDARTLDLDLLLVQRRIDAEAWELEGVDGPGLRVPHPEMAKRDFVLEPLRELVGEAPVVGGRPAGWWLARLGDGERTVLGRAAEGSWWAGA